MDNPATDPPTCNEAKNLASESVKSLSLALEGIHDIHRSHSLPACVLRVGDTIADHILQEHLEDTTSLLVDETTDTLDTTTTGKTTNGWLGDTLDVITEHLSVTLGTSLWSLNINGGMLASPAWQPNSLLLLDHTHLSKSLSSFTAARHDESNES
jgi:hypothetical protein